MRNEEILAFLQGEVAAGLKTLGIEMRGVKEQLIRQNGRIQTVEGSLGDIKRTCAAEQLRMRGHATAIAKLETATGLDKEYASELREGLRDDVAEVKARNTQQEGQLIAIIKQAWENKATIAFVAVLALFLLREANVL